MQTRTSARSARVGSKSRRGNAAWAARGSSLCKVAVTTEGRDYGALKILCEREAEKQFPGRTLIVRPASIAGPSDTHPYIFYWLQRMHHGGEVLAVGDPHTPVQFIDVPDLAEWIIRMIEKRETGIYNAVGLVPPSDLAGLVNAARATIAGSGVHRFSAKGGRQWI